MNKYLFYSALYFLFFTPSFFFLKNQLPYFLDFISLFSHSLPLNHLSALSLHFSAIDFIYSYVIIFMDKEFSHSRTNIWELFKIIKYRHIIRKKRGKNYELKCQCKNHHLHECFTFIQFHRSSSLRGIGKGLAASRQALF